MPYLWHGIHPLTTGPNEGKQGHHGMHACMCSKGVASWPACVWGCALSTIHACKHCSSFACRRFRGLAGWLHPCILCSRKQRMLICEHAGMALDER